MQVERRRIQAGSAHIDYRTAGAGRPVVFIHGLSGSSRWWTRNVPAFAEHFQVFAIDLIGFGSSRGHRFVLNEAARHVSCWMRRIGLSQASIVGHSMGGYIAADLAVAYPELVEQLVLVDAVAMPAGRAYARHTVGLLQTVVRLPARFWPVLISDALRASPVTILLAAREVLSADLSERLAKIQVPTLIVWGEHDTMIPRAAGERMLGQLSDGRLAVIPGAGHNPMWDRPDAFNRVVLDFLLTPPGLHDKATERTSRT